MTTTFPGKGGVLYQCIWADSYNHHTKEEAPRNLKSKYIAALSQPK